MKRLCQIFLVSILCALPIALHAEMIFGVSPAKIQKEMLLNSILDQTVTFSRAEASVDEAFSVSAEGDLSKSISLEGKNEITLEKGKKEFPLTFKIDSHSLPVDKITSGTLVFTLLKHGTQSAFTIRPAIGIKMEIHVLLQPTLFMKATDLSQTKSIPDGLQLTQFRIESNPQTKNKQIVLEVSNHSQLIVRNIPYSITVSIGKSNSVLPSIISNPLDLNEQKMITTPFDFSRPGTYHMTATLGTQTQSLSFHVWPDGFILTTILELLTTATLFYLLFVVIDHFRKPRG